jgi:hypothetical protein
MRWYFGGLGGRWLDEVLRDVSWEREIGVEVRNFC